MDFYKKAIFVFLLFLFFMIVFVKMLEPVVEKQISNIFSDKKISTKLKEELNWTPIESFESGLKKTVEWYLTNDSWLSEVTV